MAHAWGLSHSGSRSITGAQTREASLGYITKPHVITKTNKRLSMAGNKSVQETIRTGHRVAEGSSTYPTGRPSVHLLLGL